jgi:dolichyl-phosphate-mannose-protein mannosyltransferase
VQTLRDWDGFARLSVGLGALIRVLVVLVLYPPTDHIYSDQLGYVQRAMRVAELAPLDRYDAFYPPGTHLLLAVPFALVGVDDAGLLAGAVLWGILSSLTPYFMWRYARLVLSPAAAALTAAFCALWPIHIAYAGHFLSETPALAFLVASLWLAERARRRSPRSAFLAGICSGLAIANRPAMLLNVVLAAWPYVRRSRRHLGALAAGVVLILAGIVGYSSAAAGHLTLSENGGLVFFLGHCDVKRVDAGPPEAYYSFQPPVSLQLGRGHTVSYPDRYVGDQTFFYSQGLACIASDGLLHAGVLLRNVSDMGLTTIPWPAVNDPIVREVVGVANVGYVAVLPFIVFGAVRLIRRRWPFGGGRAELSMLLQLSTVLVTALVFLGEPRYRAPFDIFGLALAASLIADRYLDPQLEQWRPGRPDVRAGDAIEEHDEGVLHRRQSAREIDSHDARGAEAERKPAVVADDDTLQQG